MCDPFLPGLSVRKRLSALKKWESAWHSLDLREPTLQLEIPEEISTGVVRYELHEGYLIGLRRHPPDDRALGYTYIDLHDAVKRGYASWNTADIHQSLYMSSYCFNVRKYNLAVILVL